MLYPLACGRRYAGRCCYAHDPGPPGSLCARPEANGPSGGLGDVYGGIGKWIEDQGLQVAAAPRETYWTDFHTAAADDEVFDVAFPVG